MTIPAPKKIDLVDVQESVAEYLLSRPEASMRDIAVHLARAAHAGQRDKLGVDYIRHPLAVMRRVSTDDEKVVAVLHDVVEDTAVTLDYLRTLGFEEHIVRAVDAVTKRPGEPLAESMARVVADPLALTVKRADISHNADPVRQTGLSDGSADALGVLGWYGESAAHRPPQIAPRVNRRSRPRRTRCNRRFARRTYPGAPEFVGDSIRSPRPD